MVDRVKHLQHINSFNLLKQHLREQLGQDFHLYTLKESATDCRTIEVSYSERKYALVVFELDGTRNWQLYCDVPRCKYWVCDMETIKDAFNAIDIIDAKLYCIPKES